MKAPEDPSPEVKDALTTFELSLYQSPQRIETRGQKGRKVSVLLTKAMKNTVATLVDNRKRAGILDEQDLLFARPGNSKTPYRGSDCLRKFAAVCNATKPEL